MQFVRVERNALAILEQEDCPAGALSLIIVTQREPHLALHFPAESAFYELNSIIRVRAYIRYGGVEGRASHLTSPCRLKVPTWAAT